MIYTYVLVTHHMAKLYFNIGCMNLLLLLYGRRKASGVIWMPKILYHLCIVFLPIKIISNKNGIKNLLIWR